MYRVCTRTLKGQINIGYKRRRIAYNNTEMLVGQSDRYSTIPYASVISYAAQAANVSEASIVSIRFLPAPELKDKIAATTINTLVE